MSYDVFKYGYLTVQLTQPPENQTTMVEQGSEFQVQVTMTCSGGAGAKCGDVYGTVRHNDPDMFLGNSEVCDGKDNGCNSLTVDGPKILKKIKLHLTQLNKMGA